LCAALSLAAARQGAAKTGTSDFLVPGYRPAPNSDEKGLWSLMDRAESDLKYSRFVVRDPGVDAYLREVACRLAQDYCPDVRLYLVRTAQFNASMAPNGMMQVWTGLLLRCVDEAQLAAIVGHEMGHYLRRHTVKRWRDLRSKADVSAFLGLGLAVAGLGTASPLANLVLLASAFAYSREQEREADDIGLDLMARAGYAPIAAAEVWQQLITESKASTAQRSRQLFFATHPEPEQRMTALRAAGAKLEAKADERGREAYLAALAGLRGRLIGDELALRQYGRSEVVFDRLLAQVPDDGALWYAKGEVYRLRAGAGDRERALAAYERALKTASAPPETYRSLMLVELKAGETGRAHAAFDEYLRRKPDAADADSLRMLLPK
jgi:predicted Zn-dependent protease